MAGQFSAPWWPKNTQEGDLSRTRRHRKVFWAFFYMFWDMNLKSGIHIRQVARHIKFEFHHNQASASGEFFRLFLSVLRYQFESWFIHAVSYCSYCTISQLQWAKDNRIPWDSHCPWSIRGRNIYEWIILIYDKITKKTCAYFKWYIVYWLYEFGDSEPLSRAHWYIRYPTYDQCRRRHSSQHGHGHMESRLVLQSSRSS